MISTLTPSEFITVEGAAAADGILVVDDDVPDAILSLVIVSANDVAAAATVADVVVSYFIEFVLLSTHETADVVDADEEAEVDGKVDIPLPEFKFTFPNNLLLPLRTDDVLLI